MCSKIVILNESIILFIFKKMIEKEAFNIINEKSGSSLENIASNRIA